MLGLKCANCLAPFNQSPIIDGKLSLCKFNALKYLDLRLEKNQNSPEENIREISVAQAFAIIFNIPFTTTSVSPDEVYVCYSCYIDLRALFINYKTLLHRQGQESWLSQRIELARQSEGRKEIFLSRRVQPNNIHNNNNNSRRNSSSGGVEKSTQTDDVDLNSFINTQDDGEDGEDDGQSLHEESETEIKIEAEDVEFDEYSDPLQIHDEYLNRHEEDDDDDDDGRLENKSSFINNISVVSLPAASKLHEHQPSSSYSHSNSNSTCDSQLQSRGLCPAATLVVQNKKDKNSQSQETTTAKIPSLSVTLGFDPGRRNTWESWNKLAEDFPTCEIKYNLPPIDCYTNFRLKSLQPPLISPCECESREFETFAHYKQHVQKHVHHNVLKCPEPALKPSRRATCYFKSWDFKHVFKHCVRIHQKKLVEPEDEKDRVDVDELLNKNLLPETMSEETEDNLWFVLHSDLVQKIKNELKSSSKVDSSLTSKSKSRSKSKSNQKKTEKETETIPPPPYKCEKCYLDPPVEFQRLESYIMHMGKDVHKTRVYTCADSDCSREFYGKSGEFHFIQHCQRAHQVTPDLSILPVPVTVKEIDSKMKQEMEMEETKGKTYKAALELLGNPPYNCPGNHDNENENEKGGDGEENSNRVKFSFDSMPEFWEHLKTVHFSKKEFICPKCGKMYNIRNSFFNHIHFCGRTRKKTRNRAKLFLPPFICDFCQREFSTRYKLTSHRYSHEKKEKFPCEVCGKLFGSRDTLEGHLGSHRNQRPFVCESCGRSYITRTNLRMHQRIAHGGEEERKKYNEYNRLKRQRRKNKEKMQNEQKQENENENESQDQEENPNLNLDDLDFEMEDER